MDIVLNKFYDTRRFVISNNVRFYNYYFKNSNFKYYVENQKGMHLISFLRKNNKVLLNVNNLCYLEKQFFMEGALDDILENVEIIAISSYDFDKIWTVLQRWHGNVIIE